MLENSANYNWVSLTPSEQEAFVNISKGAAPQHPTFFNLATDSKNAGGRFAELSKDEVIQKAIKAAKWLLNPTKA